MANKERAQVGTGPVRFFSTFPSSNFATIWNGLSERLLSKTITRESRVVACFKLARDRRYRPSSMSSGTSCPPASFLVSTLVRDNSTSAIPMKMKVTSYPVSSAFSKNDNFAPTGSEKTVSVIKLSFLSTRLTRSFCAISAASIASRFNSRAKLSALMKGCPLLTRKVSKKVLFPAPFGPARIMRTGFIRNPSRNCFG